MLSLSDDVYKLLGGFIGAVTIALTIVLNWRKERKIDEANREATKESVPLLMQGLARVGTPMAALQVDQVNDAFRMAEKLLAAVDRQSDAIDLLTEETRLAAVETRRAAVETRRFHEKIEDLVAGLHPDRR